MGFGDESGDKSEKPFDDEPFDAGVEADEDEDPEKFIQQLAGKLGTSLRKYNDERGEPDLELEKYAINSVISATHTAEMDEEDQKDIIKKIKMSGAGDENDDIDKDLDVDSEEPVADKEELEFGSEEELEENDMLTQNLRNMKDDADEILSMDKDELKKKLRGHDWALDHISTSTDDTEEVADFLTTEEGYIALGDDIEITEDEDPCWDGYEMVGMKEKGGKEVPNCVPVDENNSMYEEWSRPMEISEGTEVSEELQYHLDNKIALGENVFRYGSESYLNLFEEVKNLYEQNLINLNENDELIINDFINESGDFDGLSVLLDIIHEDFQINEAEYKGKEVELNKPKRGGSKKFYVYVKDGDKVKKVSFGAKSGGGNLAVKLQDPKARKAFADRHNCKDKNDKTTPGYWSCRLPRYAKMLGLSGGGTWW